MTTKKKLIYAFLAVIVLCTVFFAFFTLRNRIALPILEKCEKKCGDGFCQEVTCAGHNCSCSETTKNCPQDCQKKSSLPLKKCGMENCHGMDIACGPNTPSVCDEMYMIGDNCRQFASCQFANGQCKLEKDLRFDNCVSCVKKCEGNFKNDPSAFFQCEGECAK